MSNLNTIRAAFMRRASEPDINPFALKLAYLIAYKYLNNETGTARPAQATLAADLNVTSRTVRTLLDILHPLGLVIVPGHGPNRASTYWIDPDKATPRSPVTTDKRKPASGYKRKPASGLKPPIPEIPRTNTGNLTSKYRKPASTQLKKKNQEEELRRAGATAPALEGESARELALAVPPGGALVNGAPEDRFPELLAIWNRPWGEDDEPAARRAFALACREADPDEIIASARTWVAAVEPRFLKPVAKWLAKGLWRKPPPPTSPRRRGGKVSLAELMLARGRSS